MKKEKKETETVLGIGQYSLDSKTHTAEVAFAVRDDYQNRGIGWELLSYLTYLAKKRGLLGFTAEVLAENRPMLHLFEKAGFTIVDQSEGMYTLRLIFSNEPPGRKGSPPCA